MLKFWMNEKKGVNFFFRIDLFWKSTKIATRVRTLLVLFDAQKLEINKNHQTTFIIIIIIIIFIIILIITVFFLIICIYSSLDLATWYSNIIITKKFECGVCLTVLWSTLPPRFDLAHPAAHCLFSTLKFLHLFQSTMTSPDAYIFLCPLIEVATSQSSSLYQSKSLSNYRFSRGHIHHSYRV